MTEYKGDVGRRRGRSGARMRVASIPADLSVNPYLDRLHDALARRGIETVAGTPRLRWALRARSQVAVVHLHWIELFVHGHRSGAAITPSWPRALYVGRAARFLAALALLRASGIRIVWTVHNLRPHEQRFPVLDRLMIRAVAALSHAIVVHSDFARRRLVADLGRTTSACWVAPHGNYEGSYPPPRRGRERMREELDIGAETFVFLVFGQLRAYKRVDEVIGAFRQMDAPDIRLVIAGRPFDDDVRDCVVRAAGSDPRVRLLLDYIDDADVADLHAIADAGVVAYVEAFSSGALLLALSQGLAVVAPRESSAAESGDDPALVTFAPGRLQEALMEMRGTEPETRRSAALDAAAHHSWELAAERIHAAYDARDPDSPAAWRSPLRRS